MKKTFERFLKQKNLYDEYLINTKDESINGVCSDEMDQGNAIDHFINVGDYESMISGAFKWHLTDKPTAWEFAHIEWVALLQTQDLEL